MRALMSSSMKTGDTKSEGITDGIDITTWTVKSEAQSLTYSVWDFAGQTVYYNTHQVIITNLL